MVQKYSLEAARAALPDLDELSQEKKEKALFYLGMMTYASMITKASTEVPERQIIINELLHDEIDTEGMILLHELKQS